MLCLPAKAVASFVLTIASLVIEPARSELAEVGYKNEYYQATGYAGSRVLEHNRTGRFTEYIEVAWFASVAVDTEKRVWVVDRTYHQVLMLEPNTRYVPWPAYYIDYAGSRGKPGHRDGSRIQARFDSPMGLAVNLVAGEPLVIYVADSNNHCIRRLEFLRGRVATIAGSPKNSGYRDGIGGEARFSSPMNMGVDSVGLNLFVLDNTRVIRYINLNGYIVTTLVGGACRAISKWTEPSAPSVVMRSVGCHTDWLMRDAKNDEEKPDQYLEEQVCVGHRATCGPRNHPALHDSRSANLHMKPFVGD